MTNKPARQPALSRSAIERVLARAAELQAQAGDDEAGLNEAQVIEIAGEVGLSANSVRQAIAEVRAHAELPAEHGMAFSLLGTAIVQATRAVPGDASTVLAAMDEWMRQNESLQVKRRFADQLSWEPREDFIAAIRRALRVGGRGFHLATSTEVRAIAVAAEPRSSHVRLIADFTGSRERHALAAILGAVGVGAFGLPTLWVATTNGLALLGGLAVLVGLGVPALAVSLIRRRYRHQSERARVALEQALDRLEFEGPRSLG